jgi:hypothetical protein
MLGIQVNWRPWLVIIGWEEHDFRFLFQERLQKNNEKHRNLQMGIDDWSKVGTGGHNLPVSCFMPFPSVRKELKIVTSKQIGYALVFF